MAKSDDRDPGPQLHTIAGGVVAMLVLAGYIREVYQHDLTLTIHQWIEALAWGGGAGLVFFVGIPLAMWLIRRFKR